MCRCERELDSQTTVRSHPFLSVPRSITSFFSRHANSWAIDRLETDLDAWSQIRFAD